MPDLNIDNLQMDEADKLLFETAYNLAKDLDIQGLRDFIAANDDLDEDLDFHCVDDGDGLFSLAQRLAQDGFHDAVEMLIQHVEGDENGLHHLFYATYGYVDALNLPKTLEFIARQDSQYDARLLSGYALDMFASYGKAREVRAILKKHPELDVWDAVKHALKNGHTELAEELCVRDKESSDLMVEYYARRGELEKLNEWIELGTKYINREFVAHTLGEASCFTTFNSAVDTLVHFDSNATRKAILSKVDYDKRGEYRLGDVTARAAKLNKMMREYGISCKQARALEMKGMRAWLLQGKANPDLNLSVNHDAYFKIVSMATGLSRDEIDNLRNAVRDNTHLGAKEMVLAKQPNTLFSNRYGMNGAVRRVRHREELADLEERYQPKRHRG